ncbi:hypothetical protein J1614_009252 [Plenodomus biglobosus]|nr:hypothetical protein J1614_009252 [Plenodomus biglobosus]
MTITAGCSEQDWGWNKLDPLVRCLEDRGSMASAKPGLPFQYGWCLEDRGSMASAKPGLPFHLVDSVPDRMSPAPSRVRSK